MKIAYLSDLHLDFDPVAEEQILSADFSSADVIVFAGDLYNSANMAANFLHKFIDANSCRHVFFVPGNHEYYNTPMRPAKDMFRNISAENFTYLEGGRKFDINGVTFIGDTLWTDFMLYGPAEEYFARSAAEYRMADYRNIYEDFVGGTRFSTNAAAGFHRFAVSQFRKCAAQSNGPVVCVSHHAPSIRSVHPGFTDEPWKTLNGAYASGLLDSNSISYSKEIAENVTLWIHGHMHNSVDYITEDNVRVVTNPKGYAKKNKYTGALENENTYFQVIKIVEI